MKKFESSCCVLGNTHLIEASAGTGKTYTITELYLRLLLDDTSTVRGLYTVQNILVVTFTRAATAELRSRIRMFILDAREYFIAARSEKENGGDDSFSRYTESVVKEKSAFVAVLVQSEKDLDAAIRLLEQAARSFDEAAIFTIHSFCERILRENAFESNILFDTEFLSDESEIVSLASYDFWRQRIYPLPEKIASFLVTKKTVPASFLPCVVEQMKKPNMHIEPVSFADYSSAELLFQYNELEKIFSDINTYLHDGAPQKIMQQYIDEKIISGTRYSNKYNAGRFEKIMYGLSQENIFELDQGSLKFFVRSSITASLKNESQYVEHAFFGAAENYIRVIKYFETYLVYLTSGFIKFVCERCACEKSRRNVMSFNDLIVRLSSVLSGQGAEKLIVAVSKTYNAALIDEFQDTDPMQYEIFTKLFPKGKTLFLIGDPKQAIYSFRGADIFAYIKAKRAVDESNQLTLSYNWRSDERLICAVNHLFSSHPRPFVQREIGFEPVGSARKKASGYAENGKEAAPFDIWYIDAPNDSAEKDAATRISKEHAAALIASACAGEIVRMLNDGAMIDGRPVVPSDIAVLTRSHSEGKLVYDELVRLHVPAVICKSGSVFTTDEAGELAAVLAAAADPSNERLVRAACATRMVGFTSAEIVRFYDGDDEAGWEKISLSFHNYRDTWTTGGFMKMFSLFAEQQHVREKLASLENGPRRLTNLFHLAEILHQVSLENMFGISGLLRWLAERRRDDADVLDDEKQLRLETDDDAVKIMTVHVSKGLEFGICFCPFMWGGTKIASKPFVIFHREHDSEIELVMDIKSEKYDEHMLAAQNEELAENMRLLYVALTRAKYRCVCVFGFIHKSETSALSYLFHGKPVAESENVCAALKTRLKDKKITPDILYHEIAAVADGSGGTIRVKKITAQDKASLYHADVSSAACEARLFTGNVSRGMHISSFSQLTRNVSSAGEFDEGASHAAVSAKKTGIIKTIHDFPAGARAGSMLHEIYEKTDFTAVDGEMHFARATQNALRAWGFVSADDLSSDVCGQSMSAVVGASVDEVLSARIIPHSDFFLKKLPIENRLTELEFYFPVDRMESNGLKNVFDEFASGGFKTCFPDHLSALGFETVKGFIKGFIDLVFCVQGTFYIIDWKSNRLGDDALSYTEDAVRDAMDEHFYTLQYHLYVVALDRYLRFRLKDYSYQKNFGGVSYIFLRGVDRTVPMQSIWFDKPDVRLVNALSAYFESGEVRNA